MDQQKIIADIEERAQRANLSISELCRQADLHPTTFSRWKKSERNPEPIGATLASLSKLEEVLAAAEAAVTAKGEPESEAA